MTIELEKELLTIVLSGAVCAGKSTLAGGLAVQRGATVLTTRALIANYLDAPPDGLQRQRLQEVGDELDAKRGGEWVATGLRELIGEGTDLVVVDSIRKQSQLTAVAELGSVLHVHLTADEDDLAKRYRARQAIQPELEFPSFNALRLNATEADVERLGANADLVIDTSDNDSERTLKTVLDQLSAKRTKQ
jgi:adenylosuccinate synthase